MSQPKLIDVVNKNFAEFLFFRNGEFYYSVTTQTENPYTIVFPVPLAEIPDCQVNAKEKAITFMTWIKRAMAAELETV
jgi:hypothetical protein